MSDSDVSQQPVITGQTLDEFRMVLKGQLRPVCLSDEQAAAETDWLLQETIALPAADFYTRMHEPVPPEVQRAVLQLLSLRTEKRIPLQYLLHQAWFYGLKFYVNPHVLIPRPETELLVEEAVKRYQNGMRILDIGTGPGTIAIAISHTLGPGASVTAVDISPDALKVARINQRLLNTHVDFRLPGDLLAPVAGERFDLIVSNPPYIDPALKTSLSPEVAWHEPHVALFPPDADAFYFYRRLAEEAPACLNPQGVMLLELGHGMAEIVAAIFREHQFDVTIRRDYAGIERVLTCQL